MISAPIFEDTAMRADWCEFELRRDVALARLDFAGVPRSHSAPWLYRTAWHFHVGLRPPHFASAARIAGVMGSSFGLAWGTFMWGILWAWRSPPLVICLWTAALAGLLFGVTMAVIIRKKARALTLPAWEDIPLDVAAGESVGR
jgi:Family of unknown function (DUF6404)